MSAGTEYQKFLAQPGLRFDRSEANINRLTAMMGALRSAFPLNYDVVGFNAANEALKAVDNALALYKKQKPDDEPPKKGERRVIGV